MAENPREMASSSSQPSSTSENSSQDPLKQSQAPAFSTFPAFPHGYYQMFPVMYPALVPGLMPSQDQDQINRGAGIYAVPIYPSMGRITGLPSNTLIPLTYSTPTSISEAITVGENQGQTSQQPQQQQPGHQIYQTGALKPIIRWLSQGMQGAAAQPLPPRPAGRPQNTPLAGEGIAPGVGQAEGEIGNPRTNNADRGAENENAAEPGASNGGNQWWGIVKEIQMIIFGFITSLLPGFHFHNHLD